MACSREGCRRPRLLSLKTGLDDPLVKRRRDIDAAVGDPVVFRCRRPQPLAPSLLPVAVTTACSDTGAREIHPEDFLMAGGGPESATKRPAGVVRSDPAEADSSRSPTPGTLSSPFALPSNAGARPISCPWRVEHEQFSTDLVDDDVGQPTIVARFQSPNWRRWLRHRGGQRGMRSGRHPVARAAASEGQCSPSERQRHQRHPSGGLGKALGPSG